MHTRLPCAAALCHGDLGRLPARRIYAQEGPIKHSNKRIHRVRSMQTHTICMRMSAPEMNCGHDLWCIDSSQPNHPIALILDSELVCAPDISYAVLPRTMALVENPHPHIDGDRALEAIPAHPVSSVAVDAAVSAGKPSHVASTACPLPDPPRRAPGRRWRGIFHLPQRKTTT